MNFRVCTKCNVSKELGPENFGKVTLMKKRVKYRDFDNQCRTCRNAKSAERFHRYKASGNCAQCGKREPMVAHLCHECWFKARWYSIQDRAENRNGKCPSYANVKVQMQRDEFFEWCRNNPPPMDMKRPSIDRINNSIGYRIGNIRWLEFGKNVARAHLKGLTTKPCAKCHEIFPRTPEYYYFYGTGKICHMCKPCYRRKIREENAVKRATRTMAGESCSEHER